MAFVAIAVEGERELSWGQLRKMGVPEEILGFLANGPVEKAAEALAVFGLDARENPSEGGYHVDVWSSMPDAGLRTDR